MLTVTCIQTVHTATNRFDAYGNVYLKSCLTNFAEVAVADIHRRVTRYTCMYTYMHVYMQVNRDSSSILGATLIVGNLLCGMSLQSA